MTSAEAQGKSNPVAIAIAITVGEPAGIGPDICLRLSKRQWAHPLVLIGDKTSLDLRAAALGLPSLPTFLATADPSMAVRKHPANSPSVSIWDHPLPEFVLPGSLNPRNSIEILPMLRSAIHGCRNGYFAAMVTAPVHKAAINDASVAGETFTGHTEFLAQETGTEHVVMMLVGGGLSVALATTHIPLAAVPAAITTESLTRTLRIVEHDLRQRFGLQAPRIAVCGLNPHAGEGGYLGREEIDVITPVIESLKLEGMKVSGPYPADTIFVPLHAEQHDCILAMYHDQGLAPLKRASFGGGVNITLGLPIIRTSVDHGTALDLAGTGRADPGSLFAAVELAIRLAAHGSHSAS